MIAGLSISQIAAPEDIAAGRDLVVEFTQWAFTLESDGKTAPTFAGLEAELAALPGVYGPPAGLFLLARVDGAPVGCVALCDRGLATAEVKRMYVRPAARGRGVGAALVAAVVAEARTLGYRRVALDSHRTMHGAHALYRAAGFQDAPPWPGFPAHIAPRVVFMDLALV